MVRVIVTMTTIPSRTSKILPVLQSLIAQTYPYDSLCLYIPKSCVRQNSVYEFPLDVLELQKTNKRFQIKQIECDYGPATKIIPAMKEYSEQKEHPILISVDDDVLLEQHSIEELVAAHIRNPMAVLGFMGVVDGQFHHAEHVPKEFKVVDALGGYRSILYPPMASAGIPLLWQALHEEHQRKLQRPVIDDDHGLQECEKYLQISREVVRTNYRCMTHTPETQLVPYLNIRFLPNIDDGVSSEGNIAPSRDITNQFFAQFKMK